MKVHKGRGDAESARASRRMALLRRAGLFGSDTRGAVIRRAVTDDDLIQGYRLVHDAFAEQGYIQPTATGLRMRPFEALPSMATFIAVADGKVVGVQGLAVDGPHLGLPSDDAFQDVLDELRVGRRRVCEATNQAIAPEYRKSAVPTELMRCMFAHGLAVGCDELITTVSPGHARFFNLLGFTQVSDVRSYSRKTDDPVVVMRVNVAELIARAEQANDDSDSATLFIKIRCLVSNPYRKQVKAWDAEARTLFDDQSALRRLFVEDSGLIPGCTRPEREAIRGAWGDATFAAVTGDVGQAVPVC